MPKPVTCESCQYASKLADVMLCRRSPPSVAVIENKPMTIRVSVNANDPSCGEYKRRANGKA